MHAELLFKFNICHLSESNIFVSNAKYLVSFRPNIKSFFQIVNRGTYILSQLPNKGQAYEFLYLTSSGGKV